MSLGNWPLAVPGTWSMPKKPPFYIRQNALCNALRQACGYSFHKETKRSHIYRNGSHELAIPKRKWLDVDEAAVRLRQANMDPAAIVCFIADHTVSD